MAEYVVLPTEIEQAEYLMYLFYPPTLGSQFEVFLVSTHPLHYHNTATSSLILVARTYSVLFFSNTCTNEIGVLFTF